MTETSSFPMVPTGMQVETAERPLSVTVVFHEPPFPMVRVERIFTAHFIAFLKARGHTVNLFYLNATGQDLTAEEKAWLDNTCHHHEAIPHKLREGLGAKLAAMQSPLPTRVLQYQNAALKTRLEQHVEEAKPDLIFSAYIFTAEATRGLATKIRTADGHTVHKPPAILDMHLSYALALDRAVMATQGFFNKLPFMADLRKYQRYEANIWRDYTHVVLAAERDLQEVEVCCHENNTPIINNAVICPHGIDTQRYKPTSAEDSAADPMKSIVFGGDMGKNENILGITWFVRYVWPDLHRDFPNLQLIIAGRNPAKEIQALNNQHSIKVLGEVPDMQEVIANATICIDPAWTGAGVQNKLIEFMAMAKPVVATTVANEAIQAEPEKHLMIADVAPVFCAHIAKLLTDETLRKTMGNAARKFIEQKWTWEARFLMLEYYMHEAVRTAEGQ